MILWTNSFWANDEKSAKSATAGIVTVVARPLSDHDRFVSKQYASSYGACNVIDWREPKERLRRLFEAYQRLVVSEGMNPRITHEALLAIPEYRQAITSEQFGATYIEDGVERLVRGDETFNQANLEATRFESEIH